ncbi:Intraflagellar transport protein 81 [Chionoecetes opilio]|uniref:Intraflagellar transport protein 81 n=1 Tax=Chionoecetes opilio TaxID=41210 RepID=A0A8J5CZT7_CHIOP|nr:Intraflagellar transport protein 81 [Chionoecetes opilio]
MTVLGFMRNEGFGTWTVCLAIHEEMKGLSHDCVGLSEERRNTMEAQMGVSGFHETQDTMEQVSSLKASVDARKGQSLEDMSGMVMELNRKIAERKSQLAPIIKGEIVLLIITFCRIESADTCTYGNTPGAWHSVHHYDLCFGAR